MARIENLLGALALAVTDAAFAPAATGLPRSAQSVLVSVHAYPGRPVSWVRDLLGLTSSGATRLVDELESAGLLVRRPGADARSKRVDLTPSGRAVVRDLLRSRDRAIAGLVKPLPPDDRADLERILATLVAGLADDRPGAERVCRMCDRHACAGRRAQGCPLDHTVSTDE